MAHSTNKNKLVRWDADFYKALSATNCLYCLTEQQVYIVAQSLQQALWDTRWLGDTSGMDLNAIVGEIEERMATKYCTDVALILDMIESLQGDVNILLGITENQNTYTPYNAVDSNLYQPQFASVLTEPLASTPCGTNEERDILYGGVISLADFMVAQVTDFLEVVEQNIANPPELVENMVEAVPGLGLLPIDDVVEYAGWLIDQLLDAWNATVDEVLIQQFRCDLFCLAIDHNCTLTPELILEYINSKLPVTAADVFKNSLVQAISFITTGNFVGDDYFYIMIGLQLNLVLMGQNWLRARGWTTYQYYFAAGKLEPNNGHEIFCTECPVYYSYIEWDFTQGEQGWVFTNGTYTGSFITGDAIDATIDLAYLGANKPDVFGYAYDIDRLSEIPGHGSNETTAGATNTDAEPDTGNGVDTFFAPDGRQQVGATHFSSVGVSANILTIRLRAVGANENKELKLFKFRAYLRQESPYKGLPTSHIPSGNEFNPFTFWILP